MSRLDEQQLVQLLSQRYDQVIQLDEHEAQALFHATQFYLRLLVMRSEKQPMYPEQAQGIRVVHRVMLRLRKLLQGQWIDSKKRPRLRKFRLDYDAVLKLNVLLRNGELHAAQWEHDGLMGAVWIKINQKAQNLNQFFQL
jgi:hypothetical protein